MNKALSQFDAVKSFVSDSIYLLHQIQCPRDIKATKHHCYQRVVMNIIDKDLLKLPQCR